MFLAVLVAPAIAETELTKPKLMDGVAIYSVDAGGARLCFGEADNHYAAAFVLLVNTGSEAAEVRPKQVAL